MMIAALALTGAAFSAQAAAVDKSTVQTIDLSKKSFGANFTSGLNTDFFADKFNFTLTGKSKIGSNVSTSAGSLDLTGFKVYTSAGVKVFETAAATRFNYKPTPTSMPQDFWTFKGLTLNSGSYYLEVDGKIVSNSAGSFSGSIGIAAVPEADTYAMLLAGLGMLGVVAARRRKQA